MELILNNHIRIKYRTTFCIVLAIYIFSIMTVSCRPSVDRIPPRPTADQFDIQQQQQQQTQYDHQHQESSQQQQDDQDKSSTLLSAAAASTLATDNDSDKDSEKNNYGDLHPDKIRQIRKCNDNMHLMELCMRCAKVTKSPIVYPMCCDNEDNVKVWCEDYVYFGITNYR